MNFLVEQADSVDLGGVLLCGVISLEFLLIFQVSRKYIFSTFALHPPLTMINGAIFRSHIISETHFVNVS